MASHSHRSSQVSTKLFFFVGSNSFIYHFYTPNLKLPIPRKHSKKISKRKSKCTAKGSTLRYRIGREAIKPPKSMYKNLKTNLILTLRCSMSMPPHDNDQDMAKSSSSSNLKRGQLTIQQSIQQKIMKSDLQFEHHKYANQNIWLGFQTMELLAIVMTHHHKTCTHP